MQCLLRHSSLPSLHFLTLAYTSLHQSLAFSLHFRLKPVRYVSKPSSSFFPRPCLLRAPALAAGLAAVGARDLREEVLLLLGARLRFVAVSRCDEQEESQEAERGGRRHRKDGCGVV